METMRLAHIEGYYKNRGQQAERAFRYTMTGRLEHADNLQGADCLGIQVKTSKASICRGLDIRAHVAQDSAEGYAYVLADLSTAYIMSPEEWIVFIDNFGHADRDSNGRNGGGIKIRLKTENKAMRTWLEARTLRAWSIDYNDEAWG